MYELNQKTIIVLDHTQYFGVSSEDFIPIDFLKGKTNIGGSPSPIKSGAANTACPPSAYQFSKSLWTCSVEASLEYCRIVWDLFPHRKLVRFIMSDAAAHIVNTWKEDTQNMMHVSNTISIVGPPNLTVSPANENVNVVHGLRAAIEALAEPTDVQREHQLLLQKKYERLKREQLEFEKHKKQIAKSKANANASEKDDDDDDMDLDSNIENENDTGTIEPDDSNDNESNSKEKTMNGPRKVNNRGRILCITSASDSTHIKNLEEIVHKTIIEQNETNAKHETAPHDLMIDHCHLVVLNVIPSNTVNSNVTGHERQNLSSVLSTEVHVARAKDIPSKLIHLLLNHYNLASTTVTGIPMKEEQNANSSANYDVEILHARDAHTAICGSGSGNLATSRKEGAEYETVTLKWCTPRGSSVADISTSPICVAQHLVTPVDVTSRPSSCLVNFLLNGRSVHLEIPRKSGGKTTSHLLSARGGEIYIHSFHTARSPLDDVAPITDGPGGKVTNYRVAEFTAHMKAHRLVPLKTRPLPDNNLSKTRNILHKSIRYFPLTYNATMAFNLQRNLPWMASLLQCIMKDEMEKSDEILCQQNIFELYTSISKDEMLPFANMPAANNNRLKGAKKTEQYRLICTELELLLREYDSSPSQKAILDNVQNIRAVCGDTTSGKNETDATAQLSGLGKSIMRATTDSPLSPPHSMDVDDDDDDDDEDKSKAKKAKRTLLDIMLSAERNQASKRPDFTGRLCTPVGQIAKLYANFGAKDKETGASNTKEEGNSANKTETSGPRN